VVHALVLLMIRLCYSNRTEALVDALGENIRAGRSSLYEPVTLVVPNPLVEGYVKRGLARRLPIAAGIEARFLRRFLTDVATATDPGAPIVDRDAVEGELLALFHDPRRLASRELEPVRAYIGAYIGDAGDPEGGGDRRKAQLAAEVASLFDEYAFSRPEMLAAWREGALAPGNDEALQRWQRELWLALYGRMGVLAARGALTLPEFFAQTPPASLRAPAAVHVFGISYVARLYRTIFGALARATDLYVYTLNPCREFWEDLEPRRRGGTKPDPRRFPRRRAGTQLTLAAFTETSADDEPVDNPLLAAWGRPGRDNMRLLNQLAECDFDARFVDPTAAAQTPCLLATLQKEVLDREPAAAGPRADDSVVVAEALDARRELEAVAAQIWARVRADASLTFADCAVIVPQSVSATYLALVEAVFEDASRLPNTIVDLPRPGESRIADAVGLLLELPLGLLGRPDVLRLALHPAVARRFPDVDPEDWVALCEHLEIVRGADEDDHAGSYLERDRLSWNQGLRRLALGAFLSGPRSGVERAFVLDGAPVLAAEVASAEAGAAAALGMLGRELCAFARAARARPATFAAHAALLRRTVAATIFPDTPDEEAALGDAYAVLERTASAVPAHLELSFTTFAEVLRPRLAAASRARHHRPPEGVTVASFLPMRALPFREVFIVGLDERAFPSSDTFGALDLRGDARQPGDVTPREQDEYLFLEALLSARDRLHLSYVCRDPVTGDPKLPSPTVRTLLEVAARGGTTLSRPPPPLERHADDGACAVIPGAERERRAVRLGGALRDAIGAGAQLPGLGEARASIDAGSWPAIADALGWAGPAPGAPTAMPRAPTLADLRRFLECPLQGSARVWLPLGDDDEASDEGEATLRDQERLDEVRGKTMPFLRDVLAHAVADAAGTGWPSAAALYDAYDRAALLRDLDGTLPGGVFGQALRTRHLELLGCWRDGLASATEGSEAGIPNELAPLWLASAPEHLRDPRLVPPIVVALANGQDVPIGGRTDLIADAIGSGTTAALIVSLIGSPRIDYIERDWLRPFFTHVALAAMGDEASHPAVLIRPMEADRTPRLDRCTFPALSAVAARGYLAALAGELLAAPHGYFLPCEAVFTCWKRRGKPDALTVRDAILLLRHDGWTRFSSDRGPIPDARNYPLAAEAEIDAIVARRFGPLLAALAASVPGRGNGKKTGARTARR
jgi:exodeoxyribonuclease V gamma subunit